MTSVTFSGDEVALVAGLIARAMPLLDEQDWEVADLMLEKALAILPRPMPADLATMIEGCRISPLTRRWMLIRTLGALVDDFNEAQVALLLRVPASEAMLILERISLREPNLQRLDDGRWMVKESTNAD